MSSSSKMFVRHKALGYVSNHIPVVTRFIHRRKENLLVTCVGKALHTYGSSHFKLLSVTDLHPEEITCTAGDKYHVYSAAGNIIYAWRRGNELRFKYVGHEFPVKLLLPFGPHLISVDETNNLKLWNIKSQTVDLELMFDVSSFQITAVMHPHTYVNKILLGSEQGYLQLWNLASSKLIYSFKGWDSGVSVIEQSPALDIVGVGLKNGQIKLLNLKYDEVVMEFQQDWGVVTALTFRMDDSPIMISGTMYGHLMFWNLDEKKVFSQILNAHGKMVSGLKCLPSEPLMVSSSPDNSLKLWIFDMPDGGARLLRFREGHSLPPTCVRFYGSDGHNLLVSGGDSSLRSFNTVTEIFNKSFGKATFRMKKFKKKKGFLEDTRKMPPISAFAYESTREKDWDNIAAIHNGAAEVTTWSYKKVTCNVRKLLHERFIKYKNSKHIPVKATATSIFITHCGNFILVGFSSGHCDKYNIQSGLHRGSFGSDTAHDGPVRGVAVDILNLKLTTGGHDRQIKWWNFKGKCGEVPIRSLELEYGVSCFSYHMESALLAVVLENFDIILIDNDGFNKVRTFTGHCGKVTDVCFSPDSKWLISSGMDCFILVWDVPSGCLVDQLRVDAPCTSLSFSPTGEYLATTHVDYLGVFLWSNRTLYNHVALKPIELKHDLPISGLPSTASQNSEDIVAQDTELDEEVNELCEQISDLVTLSKLDASKWQNLLNLDVIRKRNKPKEPLTAPSAPFFLPTVPSLDVQFDFSDIKKDGQIDVSLNRLENLTLFAKNLRNCSTTDDLIGVFNKLKKMGPSAIDFEIRSLSTGYSATNDLLLQFMKMIQEVLLSNVDFELAQAYLGLFLKVHGPEIIDNEKLLTSLEELQSIQVESWERVQSSLMYNQSVIQVLKM